MANGIVLGGKLKFRKTPSTSGDVITSFGTGTVLSVSDSSTSGWYKATVSGYGTGYLMKSYIAVAGDTVKVNASDVNVRNVANGSTVLYRLSSPATATVQDVSSGWVKIKPSGKNAGWISATYVDKSSSGSSSGGDTTVPGVVGNGPNSTISTYDIRNNGKSWVRDLKTTHPQIKIMQRYVNDWVNSNFSDVGHIAADGIYGDDTIYMVRYFQHYMSNPTLTEDGLVGPDTLYHIERLYGQIN